jgi:phosphoenolpyruvate-protein kinase (PTS system EI component)
MALGFVTAEGSRTSHVSIMARSMGIPPSSASVPRWKKPWTRRRSPWTARRATP